jgi:hypothetical protein
MRRLSDETALFAASPSAETTPLQEFGAHVFDILIVLSGGADRDRPFDHRFRSIGATPRASCVASMSRAFEVSHGAECACVFGTGYACCEFKEA